MSRWLLKTQWALSKSINFCLLGRSSARVRFVRTNKFYKYILSFTTITIYAPQQAAQEINCRYKGSPRSHWITLPSARVTTKPYRRNLPSGVSCVEDQKPLQGYISVTKKNQDNEQLRMNISFYSLRGDVYFYFISTVTAVGSHEMFFSNKFYTYF